MKIHSTHFLPYLLVSLVLIPAMVSSTIDTSVRLYFGPAWFQTLTDQHYIITTDDALAADTYETVASTLPWIGAKARTDFYDYFFLNLDVAGGFLRKSRALFKTVAATQLAVEIQEVDATMDANLLLVQVGGGPKIPVHERLSIELSTGLFYAIQALKNKIVDIGDVVYMNHVWLAPYAGLGGTCRATDSITLALNYVAAFGSVKADIDDVTAHVVTWRKSPLCMINAFTLEAKFKLSEQWSTGLGYYFSYYQLLKKGSVTFPASERTTLSHGKFIDLRAEISALIGFIEYEF